MKDELASVREALEKLQGSGRSFASSMDPEAIANYERINTALSSLSKIEEGMGWIPVSERLPELHQMVALVHIDRWWATGRDEAVNRYDAGYLNEFGEKYWAIRGHRASAINSYTHWMPLPTPPDTQQP